MRGISWLAAKPVSFSRRTLLHGVSKEYCIQSRYNDAVVSELWIWQTEYLLKKATLFSLSILTELQRNRHILWQITKSKCWHHTLMLPIPCYEAVSLIYNTKIFTQYTWKHSISPLTFQQSPANITEYIPIYLHPSNLWYIYINGTQCIIVTSTAVFIGCKIQQNVVRVFQGSCASHAVVGFTVAYKHLVPVWHNAV